MYHLMNRVGAHTFHKLYRSRNNLCWFVPTPNSSQAEVWHMIWRVSGRSVRHDEVAVPLKSKWVNKDCYVFVGAALLT
jgi:hypothetical protein